MSRFKVDFAVNGRRTEQIVSAYSPLDARRIIESQFAGQKITFWSVTRL